MRTPDEAYDDAEPTGELGMNCPICRPFDCDDPDNHLGVPPEYQIPGCHCGAAADGRDCMCFEDN
jgi:hypothetical protein